MIGKIDETAFAKINLDLRVCGRRSDGYHDLDSLVVFASVGDRLIFEPADAISLAIEGPFGAGLSFADDNLVLRATRCLVASTGCKSGVRITLDKRLPIASGIGGGSADAAATLRGLTRLWNLPHGPADLLPLAATLGADVAVCLRSTPARMQGTGDWLTPMSPPSSLPMILVNPGMAVPTPRVFAALNSYSGARAYVPITGLDRDFRSHLMRGVNDLEAPAIGLQPVIADVLGTIRAQAGCVLARMSGSGATCFGLFDETAAAERAAAGLSQRHLDWWVVATDMR